MLPMSILTFSLVVLIGRMPFVLPRQDGFEKDQWQEKKNVVCALWSAQQHLITKK